MRVPAPGFELRACLREFAVAEGIDMLPYESSLTSEEFTPGLIAIADPAVIGALRSIMDIPMGRIVKLKNFCMKWQNEYERKIRSGHYTTYELE